jgi:hypothetical protein
VPIAAMPMPKPQAIAIPKKDHKPAAWADGSAAKAREAVPRVKNKPEIPTKPFFNISTLLP